MLVSHNSGGMAQLNSTDACRRSTQAGLRDCGQRTPAAQATLGNVVATDMGGTSFDVIVVEAASSMTSTRSSIAGWSACRWFTS
jgi:N-methylhydantoinase A